MTRGVHDPSARCSVEDCDERPRGKGMCAMHYARFKRQGHVELKGTGYGEAYQFFIDHIDHTGDDCLFWPYATDGGGYGVFTRHGKMQRAHREMCEIKNGPPPNLESVVRHKCGKGHLACFNPDHLEWGSRVENNLDMAKHGTIARGANSSACKLTGRQVLEIYQNTDEDKDDLADRMGVSVQTIYDIRSGRSWIWLTNHGQN